MLNVKFKPKYVRAFEKEHNCSVMDKLDISVDNLVGLIQCGNANCSEEIAENILEQYLEQEENDVMTCLTDIIGALTKYGFLPKQLPLAQVTKQKIEKQMKKMIADLEKEEESVEE